MTQASLVYGVQGGQGCCYTEKPSLEKTKQKMSRGTIAKEGTVRTERNTDVFKSYT